MIPFEHLFPPPWRERVRPLAAQVLERARAEASARASRRLDTLHLLLALCGEQPCHATNAIEELGVNVELVEQAALDRFARAEPSSARRPVRSANLRRAFALACSEAVLLGDHHLGTEHLLLGLVRAGGGASAVLSKRGIDLKKMREAVLAVRPAR